MVVIELTKQECKALIQILKCTTRALEAALDLPDGKWTDDERKKMNEEWLIVENCRNAIGEKI